MPESNEADVTLHVGAGYVPAGSSRTQWSGHPMHSEFIEVERKFILRGLWSN